MQGRSILDFLQKQSVQWRPSLLLLLAVALLIATMAGTAACSPSLPGCPTSCGNVTVPFPFGVVAGCHLAGFNLTCDDRSYSPPKLFLGDGTVEVLEILLLNSTVTISSVVQYNATGDGAGRGAWGRGLGSTAADGPYYLTERRNRLVVVGCNLQAVLLDGRNGRDVAAACTTICARPSGGGEPPQDRHASAAAEESVDSSCAGVGCCQASIYLGLSSYDVKLSSFGSTMPASKFNQSALVFVADNVWFGGNASKLRAQPDGRRGGDHPEPAVPAVLDWAIGKSGCPRRGSDTACRSSNSFCRNTTSASHGGYSCRREAGYEGNPYVANGCQDIDECALPEKYPCYGECTNVPGSFLCLCPGGTQGDAQTKSGCEPTILLVTVGGSGGIAAPSLFVITLTMTYMLKARMAKKQKALFFKQNRGLLLQQLVNEVIAERMIFSLEELEMATNQFDERCKLGSGGHGTVYKGILSNRRVVAIKKSNIIVQKEIDDFINEVAILSQISHRNVVRLFGCCLETRVPLLVYEFIPNGTLSSHLHVEGPKSLSWRDRLRIVLEAASALAYLHSSASVSVIHRDVKSANILLDNRLTAKVSDFGASRGIPIDQEGVTTAIEGTFIMYSRLTDKSDVYSFGVILVEMLTRKKPTVIMSDNVSLIALFNLLMTQDKLYEILDPQVILEGMENAREVASLASACLSLKGQERPTTRQVEVRLERLVGSVDIEQGSPAEVGCTPPRMGNIDTGSSRQYSMQQEFLLSASFSR